MIKTKDFTFFFFEFQSNPAGGIPIFQTRGMINRAKKKKKKKIYNQNEILEELCL